MSPYLVTLVSQRSQHHFSWQFIFWILLSQNNPKIGEEKARLIQWMPFVPVPLSAAGSELCRTDTEWLSNCLPWDDSVARSSMS